MIKWCERNNNLAWLVDNYLVVKSVSELLCIVFNSMEGRIEANQVLDGLELVNL